MVQRTDTGYAADALAVALERSDFGWTRTAALFQYFGVGLRVLVRTGGRYLLLPAGWHSGSPVIVLTEGDELRFEYARGR